jgi:hypothetical protein
LHQVAEKEKVDHAVLTDRDGHVEAGELHKPHVGSSIARREGDEAAGMPVQPLRQYQAQAETR